MKTKHFIEKIDTKNRLYELDNNWRFCLGDNPGFHKVFFDDSSWDLIDIPHDYSIDREYSEAGEAQSAYKLGGVGLYRKSFLIEKPKRVILSFDGIYCDSEIYLNGTKLADHHHGYSPFKIDISDYLYFDRENILSIKTDNPVPTSRWYTGSGVFRDVELILTDDIFFENIKISDFNLEKRGHDISLEIKANISNKSQKEEKVNVIHNIYYKDKLIKNYETKNLPLKPVENTEIISKFPIKYPRLWHPDKPNLYKIESIIEKNDQILDKITNDYGFRYLEASYKTGLKLNNKPIKLKAVCLHHDQGALGARDYYRSILRQVLIVKDMGANAIRITHNPASKNLIDIANKYGILLIEEIFDGWIMDKNNNYNDYSKFFDQKIGKSTLSNSAEEMTWAEYDLKEALKRDYNAPSIIAYSLGNELMCGTNQAKRKKYPSLAKNLIKWAREIDEKRFLTIGDNSLRDGYDPILVEIEDEITRNKGFVGLNYCDGEKYDRIHKDHPSWILWQSESASAVNSRACYDRLSDDLREDFRLTSFDNSKVSWGDFASRAWYDVIKRDFVFGEAVWTGFDYLGEPTPYNSIERGFPYGADAPRSSYFGIVDTAGFPKDSYYFYRSQWNNTDTTTHLLPSWNDKELGRLAKNVPLVVYTNAWAVELIFTNPEGKKKSLGKKYMEEIKTPVGFSYKKVQGKEGHESLYMTWKTPYKKGAIEAISYDKNENIIKNTRGNSKISTPGEDTFIKLKAFYKTLGDGNKKINYITIDLVDENGTIKTDARNEIFIEVSENAEILALDSGLQTDHSPFKAKSKKAYGGRLSAIIRAKDKGPIKVKAKGKNIKEEEIIIENHGIFPKASSLNYEKYLLSFDSKTYPKKLLLDSKKRDLLDVNKEEDFATYQTFIKSIPVNCYMKNITKNAKIMDFEMGIFEEEIPIFPKSLPLINDNGNIYYHGKEISYEDFNEDNFKKNNYSIIKTSLDLEGNKYHGQIKITKLVEKYRKDAYIEDFALRSFKSEDKAEFVFDTQQIFGEIEILSDNPPAKLIFLIGENEDEASFVSIIPRKITKENNKTSYDFGKFTATFIKITGNLKNIDKIRLRSLRIKL